jgi:hydrogenase maturation protease
MGCRGTAASKVETGVVVIGMGNLVRGDDGVGRRVARILRQRLPSRITVRECEGEATELMDAWAGFAHAVVVDAARGGGAPGTVHRIEVGSEPLPAAIGSTSVHGLGLAEAIGLGQALRRIPGRLLVYAVEGSTFEAGATLSPEVESAIGKVSRLVQSEVESLDVLLDS